MNGTPEEQGAGRQQGQVHSEGERAAVGAMM